MSGCAETRAWPNLISAVGTDDSSNPYGVAANNLETPTGSFEWFFHADYCCERPTIVSFSVGKSGDTAGASRVYVESPADRSSYVWAEVTVSQVAFPEFAELNHVTAGPVVAPNYVVTGQVAAIGTGEVNPIVPGLTFGFWTGPVNLGVEDSDSYIVEPWPHWAPYIVGPSENEIQKYVGTDSRIRFGYRQASTDTVVGQITGATSFFESSLSFGCFWPDLEYGRDPIRCGIRVAALSESPQQELPDVFDGYSIPFTVPRSVFVQSGDILVAPVYVGGRVTYDPNQSVEVGLWDGDPVAPATGPPQPPATTLSVATSVAADYAETFPAGSTLEPVGYTSPIRWCLDGGPTGPVTPADSTSVKRPDRQAIVANAVFSGPSWHASHIVRQGSPLAVPNALHNLEVTFADAISLTDLNFQNFLIGNGVTRLVPTIVPYITGAYTLEPTSPGGVRLAPNRYHYFSDAANVTSSFTHAVPLADQLYGGGATVTAAQAGVIQQTPSRAEDYRADYTQESFLQMWAIASVGLRTRNRGHLDIELPASGMATQDYDQWIRRRVNAVTTEMVSPTWSVFDYQQLAIEFLIRFRVRFVVNRVVGYGRQLVQGDEVGAFDPPKFAYTAGDLQVRFESSGESVLCNEFLMTRRLLLDRGQMAQLSAGDSVTIESPFVDFPNGPLPQGPTQGSYGPMSVRVVAP